jgi:hypothetical protein
VNRIGNYFITFIALSMAVLCPLAFAEAESPDQGDPFDFASSNRWVSSTNRQNWELCITLHDGDNLTYLTEQPAKGTRDHKPVWSKTGDMITFFRATGGSDRGDFNLYKTHICVINADGTGFRELTDATHANLNPTWTRDGSNRIIFNRISEAGDRIVIYWISPDGEKNSEEMITAPDRAEKYNAEWAESGLKDGRIFLTRFNVIPGLANAIIPGYTVPGIQSYYLLNPIQKTYEPVERPNKFPVHKLSVSPSETKVAYMKDLNGDPRSYNDSVIAYADFDLENLVVKNEVVISPEDESYVDMYPRWSHDEEYIIYSSSRGGKMQQYMYSLDTEETHMVSDPSLRADQYPCFEDLPK